MIRFIKEWFSRRANLSSKAEGAPADEATTDEQPTDADTSTSSEPTAPPTIPDAVEVELQRRFNEFEHRFNDRQREILDNRENSINRWLAVVAIVLTVFGIVVPIGTYIGAVFTFKEFEEIKTQAQSYVEEIKAYRDTSEAHFQYMTAQRASQDPFAAIHEARDIRDNPKASSTDKAIAEAILLQEQGKIEEALKIWRGIADAFEEVDRELSARAWLSVGYLFYLQEKHEDAIAAYDQAIQLKPDYAGAYSNRGVAKSELGRHEDAIADYNQAIQLKPNYAEAYNNRGVAKNDLGRIDGARQDFEKARDLAREVKNNSLVALVEQRLRELDNREGE